MLGEGLSNCPRHVSRSFLEAIMRFNFENALCFGKVLVTSCLALGVAITTRHGALERENEGNHGTELQPAFERKFSIKCLQFYLSSGL